MYISSHSLQRFRHVQGLLDQLDPDADAQVLALPGSLLPRDSIIVFTGSFNPPTIAHIALLKAAQNYIHRHAPISIYAAFSKRTVDKESVERPLLLDRITLLQDVLNRRLPHVGILLFNKGLYVEQAQAIHASYPAVKRILFLMGFDKIVQILDERYYQDRDRALTDLFKRVELLVVPRGEAGIEELEKLLQQSENQAFRDSIHGMPLALHYRNVSSTQLRKDGGVSGNNTLQEVRDFMRQTRAYKQPLRQADGSMLDYYEQRVHYLQNLLHFTTTVKNEK